MATTSENALHITEGIGGVWFYHLSLTSTNATALCGAKTMNTAIPLKSWGVRGHLNEGWCSECEAKGSHSLHSAGATLTVAQTAASTMPAYCENESIPASLPPVESGAYVVLRRHGQVQKAVWNGMGWEGLSDVERYSGVPCSLSASQREQCRKNIRAGAEVPEGHKQRSGAKLSALRLARHRAVSIAQATSEEDQLLHIRDMVGHYKVANTLGVSFLHGASSEANATDRALFAWGIAQIRTRDPNWFAITGSGIETIEGIRNWLDYR